MKHKFAFTAKWNPSKDKIRVEFQAYGHRYIDTMSWKGCLFLGVCDDFEYENQNGTFSLWLNEEVGPIEAIEGYIQTVADSLTKMGEEPTKWRPK